MTASFFNHPSPNHDARPPQQAVNMLVLHYTGLPDTQAALARLCDQQSKVSAHYLIDEQGAIFALVPENRRAWHAGVAHWAGQSDINACSIGIELAHAGHKPDGTCDPFAQAQMHALVELATDLCTRHKIPQRRILGHSDVAPARKIDPGEAFDWAWLAAQGIGLWPHSDESLGDESLSDEPPDMDKGESVRELQGALADFGYGLHVDGMYGAETESVIRAFQRHFRPQQIDGRADGQTRHRLQTLLQLCQSLDE